MKSITALILSLAAGIATFAVQDYFFPPQLHAAQFVVPKAPNWRQQMIDRDPGGVIVDRMLAHLSDRLDLNPSQALKVRPLLERQHERILALLVSGPPSLTRGQFMDERQIIRDRTHLELQSLLTPDQREIATEFRQAANG